MLREFGDVGLNGESTKNLRAVRKDIIKYSKENNYDKVQSGVDEIQIATVFLYYYFDILFEMVFRFGILMAKKKTFH
jgi:hypothetical protein